MLNYELFLKDPRSYKLPNDGVATVTEPTEKAQWEVLRHELENFICDGQYQRGLVTILRSFLDTQGTGSVQSAAWISGFYGSGKSHLARVLKFLWADAPLDDGALPRQIAQLPTDVKDLLAELSQRGKSQGGLWSAVGLLGSGSSHSPRLAFLGVVLSGSKLPTDYSAAQFVLWLRQENIESAVRAHIQAVGKTLESELPFFRISRHLREAVLASRPDLNDAAGVGALINAQFPAKSDISDDELVQIIETVLRGLSGNGKLPLSLLVLDELQQYLGEDNERTLAVQNAIEACSKRFGGQLMVVATGQSAMGHGGQLGKLQGRFAIRVQLSDSDALRVVREVVLRKKEDHKAALQHEFDTVAGEISKQLVGSKISFRKDEDAAYLVADYPVLPTRRRFWEEALRALDRQGGAAQLRSQLRTIHQASRSIAERPLGFVVGADVLYDHWQSTMVESGALQNETAKLISDYEAKDTPRDLILARILKITFLLNQLPADLGTPANESVIADLLVENLRDASTLRGKMDTYIDELTASGQLLQVAGEFRVQTRESAGWNQEFNTIRARYYNDSAQINSQRSAGLNAILNKEFRSGGALQLQQGQSKEKRDISLFFSLSQPTPTSGPEWMQVPVWVRDGWNTTLPNFVGEATAAGVDSPIIHVFLPNQNSDEIRSAIAGSLAAQEVLQMRGLPTTHEGKEARSAMQTRAVREEAALNSLLQDVVKNADFRLSGGGTPNLGANTRATLLNAVEVALKRLFPEFEEGDSDRWPQTLAKVRQGNANAFSEVGYNGDIEKHPVAARVLSFVGAGKKGLEVVKHFRASPFGWGQEATQSALFALLVSGHLSATYNGSARTVRQIETAQIGGTEFRRENITLTLPQKTGIRQLLSALGLPTGGDNMGLLCEPVAPLLRKTALSSGGESPTPAVPALHELSDLEGNSGNALALEVFNRNTELLDLWNTSITRAEQIQKRYPRWREWNELLDLAPDLATLDAARNVRDAMKTNRSLLDEPDPVSPAWNETFASLKTAIEAVVKEYGAALDAELTRLDSNTLWQKLDGSIRSELLKRFALTPVEPPATTDAEQIASALRTCSLANWKTRAAALNSAANGALDEAAKILAPKSVKINLPGVLIESNDQIDAFLQTVRTQIEVELAKGNSVVI